MKNKRGAVELLVVAVALALLTAIVIFLTYPGREKTAVEDSASPSPISEATDITTLEKEFSETETGSIEADLEEMVIEADSI